jgi:hypothetical protein
MNNIQDLLLKIQKKIWEKTPDSARIAQELSQTLGVTITEKNLELRNGTLFCKVSPIVKSEIALKEKELIALLAKITPKGSITSIR